MLPTFLIFILIIGCVKADVFGYSRVTVPVNNVKFSGITLFNNIQDTEFSQRFDPKLYKSFKSDSARNFNTGQYDSQDMKEYIYTLLEIKGKYRGVTQNTRNHNSIKEQQSGRKLKIQSRFINN